MSEPAVSRYPELQDKVAVVTGAAKGIGKGIAARLAAESMPLVLADIDEESLTMTAKELETRGARVLAVPGDMAASGDVRRVFDEARREFGALHLLVNNAAHLESRSLLEADDALLDLQLATNIRGPYLCAQRAAGVMAGGGGVIVNISSVGAIRAHHRGLPYDLTKGAINAMTRAMAVDLGRYGIRVNAVGPGVTHTYRTDPAAGSEAYQRTAGRIPLRRHGRPADVAAAIAFLASEEASYITGQVIYVDGGITAQLSPTGPDALEKSDDERNGS